MRQGTSTANVLVTIVDVDGSVRIRRWTGRSAKTIQAAARRRYPTAELYFGAVWYTNSYGAH